MVARQSDRVRAKPGLLARNATEPSSSRLISNPIHNRKFLYRVGWRWPADVDDRMGVQC